MKWDLKKFAAEEPRPAEERRAKKILLVDDDEALLKGLGLTLTSEGYGILTAGRGEEAIVLAEAENPQLVILDVLLPDMNGFDVCRQLRQRGNEVPIIMLTVKTDETDAVVGLEVGADDFISKPFRLREFLARVRAQLRPRVARRGDRLGRYSFGDIEIDFETHQATRGGAEVELTPREYDILRLLIRCRGEIVSRQRMLTALWGYTSAPTTRTVDNHILKLRQKLEEDPTKPKYILSQYGEGYKFVGSVRSSHQP
jgi:two-component system alkaline phosphatase synthesis response regulator PhoP